MTEIITKQQVLEELGVSERTLETWVRARRFPNPLRMGRRACWSREAVERWKSLAFAYQLKFQPR